MSHNKQIIEKYLDGFRKTDHAQILSCVTDDVEWVIPGMFLIRGKEAFDKEIENEAFTGSPMIDAHRLIEENDVVVALGHVRCQRVSGGFLDLDFCDVFEMRGGLIKKLTSYLAQVPPPASEP